MEPYDTSDESVRRRSHFRMNNSLDHFNSSNTIAVQDESFFQCQFNQQLLSAAPRAHTDSVLHYPSPTTQHQAETQPYGSMHSTPQLSNFQVYPAINGVEMQRGGSYASQASFASQYSPASPGQNHGYSHQYSQLSPLDNNIFSANGSKPRLVSQDSTLSMYPFQLDAQDHTPLQDPILFDLPQPTNIPASCSRFTTHYGHTITISDGPVQDLAVSEFTETDRVPNNL
jgi:hypothetical protein